MIELTLDSPDGIVDCQVECNKTTNGIYYTVAILYPHLIDGNVRSKVYEHNFVLERHSGKYLFEDTDSVHPAVRPLESQISAAIALHGK